ncbi:serine carboxypeptidase-like protein [Medicago truncatula]|uniref:Serine carboxypeptidase-like protein n=1 Tax=Medicago truncatula TaxID=3880 RepID=G7KNJ0_MEDTR|nr:serine carboxypeptidase-like protein [Medicago truncatula]
MQQNLYELRSLGKVLEEAGVLSESVSKLEAIQSDDGTTLKEELLGSDVVYSWRLGIFEYENSLTFATIWGAAHMVPYTRPSRAPHLFSSFVNGRRLSYTT